MQRATIVQCLNCAGIEHNTMPLCRAARITDEISHILLYGAHTIIQDGRHKYAEIDSISNSHQLQFVTFINRGLRHARLFTERAARNMLLNLSEDFALTLDGLWVQRWLDESDRRIRRSTIAALAAGWSAWSRSIRETNLEWLSKPNPAIGRMVSDIYMKRILIDESLAIEYIPANSLDTIYVTQEIDKRLQKKALDLEVTFDSISKENTVVNTHKQNIVHYWVTDDTVDRDVSTILI